MNDTKIDIKTLNDEKKRMVREINHEDLNEIITSVKGHIISAENYIKLKRQYGEEVHPYYQNSIERLGKLLEKLERVRGY